MHRRTRVLQAGIEVVRTLRQAPPTPETCFGLGLEATAHYGVPSPDIQIGDVGLFAGLVAGLDLPAWKRRLIDR